MVKISDSEQDSDIQNEILFLIVTRFSSDRAFLEKVNKTTFGLLSGNKQQ